MKNLIFYFVLLMSPSALAANACWNFFVKNVVHPWQGIQRSTERVELDTTLRGKIVWVEHWGFNQADGEVEYRAGKKLLASEYGRVEAVGPHFIYLTRPDGSLVRIEQRQQVVNPYDELHVYLASASREFIKNAVRYTKLTGHPEFKGEHVILRNLKTGREIEGYVSSYSFDSTTGQRQMVMMEITELKLSHAQPVARHKVIAMSDWTHFELIKFTPVAEIARLPLR